MSENNNLTENERKMIDDIVCLSREIERIKAHAVEVLSETLCNAYPYEDSWSTANEREKTRARAEARALLGWDNDNNDKEK